MISQQHLDEWIKGSGVSEEITLLNVETLEDPSDIDYRLNRNNDRRWKHWEHGAGWWVSGVDPQTGEKTLLGGQFKPDAAINTGVIKGDGSAKLQKYVSANEVAAEPLFLDTGDADYWQKVLKDGTIPITILEGAKKAGTLISRDRAAISISGVTNGQKLGRLKKRLEQFCITGRNIYLGFDGDWRTNPNVFQALQKLSISLSALGCKVWILTWDGGKGIDDYVVGGGNVDVLYSNALTVEEWQKQYKEESRKQSQGQKADAPVKKTLYQEVLEQLFRQNGEYWICVRGEMYQWQEDHYCKIPDEDITSTISQYCDQYKVWRFNKEEGGYWEHPYATPGYVEKSLKWAKMRLAVAPERCNPAGINCTNGVLQINWTEVNERPRPSWSLEPHDPKRHFYLYKPLVAYTPFPDLTHVWKLQECLNPDEWDIFIKTIGASLDIEAVRKVSNRVRALLLFGEGENGKDTLRDVVSLMYGQFGITGCTFSDFVQYDKGRKFPLSKLEHSRVNWSSENTSYVSLDELQSLKQIITGEAIDIEGKSKDERSEKVRCVNLFNFNIAPKLLGNIGAINSRYAVLKFEKVFKVGANPRLGELEANPRLKNDQDYVIKNVLPGFLHLALDGLYRLMTEGINYDACKSAMQEIQMSNSHLQRLCIEVGLAYDPEGVVYAGEIWDRLEDWYKSEGVLETDINGKRTWHDQPKSFDKNVTGSNQIRARFLELFPKAKIGKKDSNGSPIYGIAFVDPKTLELPQTVHRVHSCVTPVNQNEPEMNQNSAHSILPQSVTGQGFEPSQNGKNDAEFQNGHSPLKTENSRVLTTPPPTSSNGHSVQQNGSSQYGDGEKQKSEILISDSDRFAIFGESGSFDPLQNVTQCGIEAESGGANSGSFLVQANFEQNAETNTQQPIEAESLKNESGSLSGASGSFLGTKASLRQRYEAVKAQAIAAGKWETFRNNCEPDNEEMIELAELWAEGGFR